MKPIQTIGREIFPDQETNETNLSISNI